MAEEQMSDNTIVQEYRDDPNYQEYRDDPNFQEYRVDSEAPSISDLIEQIKNNIFKVTNGANAMERAMRHIGTEKDSMQLRDKIHDTSQSTSKLVQTTTRLLHSVAEKKANKQQKVQLDLLKSQFQDAVQRFYILQKKVAEKVKVSSIKILEQNKNQQLLVSVDVDTEQEDIMKADLEKKVLKDRVSVSKDDMALVFERESRIRQLESDILDVNEIFRELGTLVQAQGETLDTVDSTVERAAENVKVGNEELIKATEYQVKSRKKMCCVVCVFFILAVILTTVIVFSLLP